MELLYIVLLHAMTFLFQFPVIYSQFHFTFYILPIHGADLVLGVQWLATLGPFLSDYAVPSIHFSHQNRPVASMGISPVEPRHASFSQFCRFNFTNSIESLHAVTVSTIDTPNETIPETASLSVDLSTLDPSIAAVLQPFLPVFNKPQRLPPHLAQDHHIHLLPDSASVNVRPYRYP